MELSGTRPALRSGIRRRLLLFNLLLLALVVALVALSQTASRHNFIERAEVATENLAATLAQSIASDLDSVDIGLRNVALDLEADFSAGAPDAARVEALLDQQLALLPQLESIRVADADGVVRHGRGVAEAPRTVIDDRGYFVRARDGRQAGAIVDGPLQARISRKWVVVVARALHDARGAFAGVVYANVSVERFASLLEGVDLGRQGAISVRGAELALVARRSARGNGPVAEGSRSVSAELQRALADAADAGRFVARTALDGVERANAYRRVGATPIVVVVGLATDDFLGAWRVQTREMVALAALVVGVLALSSLLLQRAWTREARSAQALIGEGERHRALLRSASDGMHVIDRDGLVVEMGESFAAMRGSRGEQFLTQHVAFWDVMLPAQELERRLSSFKIGETVRFGSRHRCSDGRLIDVEVVSLGVRIDGEELLYCSSRDVTERRAQARELEQHRHQLETLVAERTGQWRASELRFRALANQTLVGIYVQVRNRYSFVNPAFAQMFGFDAPEEVVGRIAAHTLIAPEDLERVNAISHRVVGGGDSITKVALAGVRRDGTRVSLETYACPIDDENGPAAIGLLLDVTAQRQAEAGRAAALLRE